MYLSDSEVVRILHIGRRHRIVGICPLKQAIVPNRHLRRRLPPNSQIKEYRVRELFDLLVFSQLAVVSSDCVGRGELEPCFCRLSSVSLGDSTRRVDCVLLSFETLIDIWKWLSNGPFKSSLLVVFVNVSSHLPYGSGRFVHHSLR